MSEIKIVMETEVCGLMLAKDVLYKKDAEISALQKYIQSNPQLGIVRKATRKPKIRQLGTVSLPTLPCNASNLGNSTMSSASTVRRGKAPLVNLFTEESNDLTREDLPTLMSAAAWVKKKSCCIWQVT